MKITVGADGWAMLFFMLLLEGNAGIICLLCAAFHELGHIFLARGLDIKLREMRLGFGGARIYTEGESLPYKKEFWLCAGGPIASLLLCVICSAALAIICQGSIEEMESLLLESGVSNGLFLCACISLSQAIVNLMPVASLDGGRMIVALFSRFGNMSIARAAETVSTVIAALVLWLAAVYLLLRTGNGIGIFVTAGCICARLMQRSKCASDTDKT